PIHSLENAVLLLGQNGLRMLIAKVAFRPIINLQNGRYTKRVAPQVWSQAELCADACNLLGNEYQADPFESFLAGLMQNVGMIVAFRIIDRGYEGQYLPDSDAYCVAFMQAVRLLSSRIAKAWDFPVNVVNVIEKLGQGDAPISQSALGQVLQVSDQVSKIRILVDHGQLEEDEYFARMGLSKNAIRCLGALRVRERHAA
ncbi:MAG: HDOD domain-containing protein, partial [Burkholderiales bacterium]|nr:HDOD domain-containing protein [Burkholderiales bacterium]